MPFENIVGRRENAGNQHFLLFPRCFFFLTFQKQALFFFSCIYLVVCKYFEFRPVINKNVVRLRVNPLPDKPIFRLFQFNGK